MTSPVLSVEWYGPKKVMEGLRAREGDKDSKENGLPLAPREECSQCIWWNVEVDLEKNGVVEWIQPKPKTALDAGKRWNDHWMVEFFKVYLSPLQSRGRDAGLGGLHLFLGNATYWPTKRLCSG